jgi:hypothetical protein
LFHWSNLLWAAIFLVLGAWLVGRFPQLNVIGKVTGS